MPHRDALEAALMRIRALEQELAAKQTVAELRQLSLNAPRHQADVVDTLFKITPESSELALDNLLQEARSPRPGADRSTYLGLDAVDRDVERDLEHAVDRDVDHHFDSLIPSAPGVPRQPEPPRKPLTTVTAHNLKIALPPGKLPRALASGLACPACTDIGALEELALTETYVEARETLRLLACPACASIYGLRQAP